MRGTIEKMPTLLGNGRGRIVLTIIALILGQATAMGLSAFATRQIFNSLHTPTGAVPYWALLGLLIAAFAYAILRIITLGLSEKLGQAYAIDFRRKFYMHLSRSPASTLSERRVGALSIRFVGDLAAIRDWVSVGLTGLASAAIIVPAAFFTLWLLHPQYLWASILPLFILTLFMLFLAPQLKPIHRQLRSERANLAIDMTERAPIANALRLLGRAKADFKLLKRRGENLKHAAVTRTKYVACLKALPEIAIGVSAVLILWLTVHTDDIKPATAAAALAVLGIAARPLMDLGRVWDIYCAWQIAKEKSENILNQKKLSRSRSGQKINTDSVDYTLEDVKIQGLKAINFHVPAGSIVGVNFGNHNDQTIINILATLEDPLAGSIQLNGIPVNEIALNQLPSLIHLITLNAPFVQGSLRRALTLSTNKRPSEETILTQAKQFGLSQLLARLGGLDGRIWEGGRNLTDDEKFSILLVRAALSTASVYVIEDPGPNISEAAIDHLITIMKSRGTTGFLVSKNTKLLDYCDQMMPLIDDHQVADVHILATSNK